MAGKSNIAAIVPANAVAGSGLDNVSFGPGAPDDSGFGYRATSWADSNANYFEFCIQATNGTFDLTGIQVRSYRFQNGPSNYRFEIATNGSSTFTQLGGNFTAFLNFWNGGGIFGPLADSVNSLCVRVVAFNTTDDTASFTVDDIAILGTFYEEAPVLSYNFYDADPSLGGANLLAAGVNSYDPGTGPHDSPEMIWVTCVDSATQCESDPAKVTVTVLEDVIVCVATNHSDDNGPIVSRPQPLLLVGELPRSSGYAAER